MNMKLTIKRIDAFLNRLCAILSYSGSVWIFILMGLIVLDVLGRVVLNRPIPGTPEIVKNSITAIVFFMIAWAAHESTHVRSLLLLSRAPVKIRKIADIVAEFIGFALFTTVIIASWEPTIKAIKIFEYEGEGALRVPTYPVRMIVILGSLLMAWQCARKLVLLVGNIGEGEE